MNTERLEHLAKGMENWNNYRGTLTAPMQKFNIAVWASGTDCCAAGAGALDASFNAQGFALVRDQYGRHYPYYKGKVALEATSLFFDVPVDVVDSFFMPHRYRSNNISTPNVTPQMVAQRIRAYIEEHTPKPKLEPRETIEETLQRNIFSFIPAWFGGSAAKPKREARVNRETQSV